ncbi:hypothetical protein [Ktedonobacter racemifer]|uniref:Transposase n=1 Tax=Ktedonobacter racemifer DSM 44963 TaxID=485913 RepID=D6TVH7_KTERA|nr:hypothetical protein [Ktedonobacter racemifer]EFH80871.1 hypothetical protein Krac_1503 [Ktedonobacter racemifer DSM 44963]EFH85380.1 hypothetical protein Krac_6593 [Ktedonobacter racemifer DSM 44963]
MNNGGEEQREDLFAIEHFPLPQSASIYSRKVARSGHISYEGRPYFVSKALAGRYIRLVVNENRLIVDVAIPLHKEYLLH